MLDWKARLSPATAHNYRSTLSRFLRFIDAAAGTNLDKLPPAPQPLARSVTITDNDFQRVYFLAPPWMKALMLLCRVLGLRHGEALRVTPRHLNKDTNCLNFHRKAEGTSNIPVSGDLLKLFQLAEQKDADAPIVMTIAERPHLAQSTIYFHWWKLLEKAGVNRHLRIHDLRRTAASKVYLHTRDLRVAQQLLGHRRIETTLRYLGTVDTAELRQAIIDTTPRDLDNLPLATDVKQ